MHSHDSGRYGRSSTNVGAGIGMSFGSSDGICAVLELPLVLRFEHGFDGVYPIPQVGVLYNF